MNLAILEQQFFLFPSAVEQLPHAAVDVGQTLTDFVRVIIIPFSSVGSFHLCAICVLQKEK